MKYLVLLGVVVLAWVLFFEGRRKPPTGARRAEDSAPQAAGHGGLRPLRPAPAARPRPCSTLTAGPICGEAHRLAGPR